MDGHQFDTRDNGKASPFPFPNTNPDGSAVPLDHSQESGSQVNVDGSEGKLLNVLWKYLFIAWLMITIQVTIRVWNPTD